ncbi:MAG TPA: MBL fold metallo-hydrolase [Holophagaceae bacterium]|nr:MBL fold metallo-hydrolase [Holophagaceae bacterium]
MIFEQLNDGNCRTYLIASADTHEAALVDPLLGREDHYLAVLKDRGLSLRMVLDTHVHADHLSGCALLRDRTRAEHVVHERSRISEGSLRAAEGRRLQLGGLPIEILHTPGHTGDSMSLRLPDRLLTGDFLFLGEGGAGRTDLPGGDPGQHWDALQKLGPLPDDLLIFPGHDYRGATHSTLGVQRRENPRLQPRSREAYVAWLQGLQLPAADWMKAVVRANLACTRVATGIEIPVGGAVCEVGAGCSGIPQMTCEELRDAQEALVLVDVRNPDEWDGPLGHLEGARLIPLPQLPARLGELEAFRDQAIVTVCKAGGRSNQAATILQEAGFRNVRSLTGGMTRWQQLERPALR